MSSADPAPSNSSNDDSDVRVTMRPVNRDPDSSNVLRQYLDGGRSNPIVAVVCGGTGSLRVVTRLFASTPKRTGIAFIVAVAGVDPNKVADAISERNGKDVEVVAHGTPIGVDRIQVIDATKYVDVAGDTFEVHDSWPQSSLRDRHCENWGPIDYLIASVAASAAGRSIGIVLSGEDLDGSRGIAKIKQANGLVLVEDPSTAISPDLPNAVHEAGLANGVVDQVGLFLQLGRLASDKVLGATNSLGEAAGSEQQMHEIFGLLETRHGIDFGLYKRGTIERRIQRRLQANNLGTVSDYLETLHRRPSEVDALYKDLLIGVTKFFRDAEAFETFRIKVVEPLVRNKPDGETIRVWCAACASGEEAYSIAILFDEAIRRHKKDCHLKVFATDAHRESLRRAATGVYHDDQVEGLSIDQLQTYFKHEDGQHRIRQFLRDKLVFAPHNILTDAPFTRIDVATCRNMLIYLLQPAQMRAIRFFHFSLVVGGMMWLGPSETVGTLSDEFEEVDKRWRLYRKIREVRLPLEPLPLRNRTNETANSQTPARRLASRPTTPRTLTPIYDLLLRDWMPPSLLVSEDLELLHVFGDARNYLIMRPGRPSNVVLDTIVESLRMPISNAIDAASESKATVRFPNVVVTEFETPMQLAVTVRPLTDPSTNDEMYLIQIESGDADSSSPIEVTDLDVESVAVKRARTLERELARTRQRLQTTVEQMETSHEELQSTNEELTASNEEMQSTVEELHSVNEELYTINAEHQTRLAELSQANNDVNNLLVTTRVGVVFLDTDLHIRRFTPAMASLLGMDHRDVGRHISFFLNRIADSSLLERIREVSRTGDSVEMELTDSESNAMLARLVPYMIDGTVNGVVLTLIDVDSFVNRQAAVDMPEIVLQAVPVAVLLVNHAGEILIGNRQASRLLVKTAEQWAGLRIHDVIDGFQTSDLRSLLREDPNKSASPMIVRLRRPELPSCKAQFLTNVVGDDEVEKRCLCVALLPIEEAIDSA